jgi:hypothetical protein
MSWKEVGNCVTGLVAIASNPFPTSSRSLISKPSIEKIQLTDEQSFCLASNDNTDMISARPPLMFHPLVSKEQIEQALLAWD